MAKKSDMVLALCKELEMRSRELKGAPVQTVYFGGGTPSVLEMSELDAIMETVFREYTVVDQPEITLEANPDDLSDKKIAELAQSPINRLSIGIQSFFDMDLKLMNRAHDSKEARASLEMALKYFDNISIDLIYGVPGMTNDRWQQNIQAALSYNVPHISSYALTVEPRTALAKFVEKGIVAPVDDMVAHEHFKILVKLLEDSGFVGYELSNFGRPGYFSRNNTAYWQQKNYVGIGPSAHSYDGKQRGWNINNNPKYMKAIFTGQLPIELERLSITDRYNEYVMTGLRTIWGVSLDKVNSEFGSVYGANLQRQAQKFLDEHLLYWDRGALKATKKGLFLADGIAADLFMLNLK
jgi:oxygen-independent coproporphyrinogen-3 oxidase